MGTSKSRIVEQGFQKRQAAFLGLLSGRPFQCVSAVAEFARIRVFTHPTSGDFGYALAPELSRFPHDGYSCDSPSTWGTYLRARDATHDSSLCHRAHRYVPHGSAMPRDIRSLRNI